MSHSILVFSRDRGLEVVLREAFTNLDWKVEAVNDEQEVCRLAAASLPDLIIIDVPDAALTCGRLRIQPSLRDTLLIVAGERSETLEAMAFVMGADDFIELPTSPVIMRARISAKVRRQGMVRTRDAIEHLGVTLDHNAHRVLADGQTIALTTTEFNLLRILMQSPGRTLDRVDLAEAALEHGQHVQNRMIDVHISSLRTKLGSFRDRIQTIRGSGYRFGKASD